ncbi:MAG TPA: ATP-binding protein, partial [Dongiaceae bacterium]|nr:ATP-binding protein [Dongiaceae bacterium]
ELATLLDTVPTPVFVAHDIECLHITGNRAADELLYIPRGAEASLSAPVEVRPCHFRALKDGRELRLDELPAQRSARGAHVEDFEFSIAFDDGTIRHVLGYGTPLRNEDGLPRGAVHVLVDITERKRAEEELLKANSNLELRVKERTEDLEATLDKLTREVAERKLIEEELQQALEAAETANSTMRRLMRTVAHEFRTPLGLLTGSVDILDRYWDRLTQEKRIEQNEHIRNAASQMSNLVNSVIAFNLSGADKRGRPPQLYDIGELCRSIAAEAEKVWCAGHEFIVSIDAACGSALIDDVLFRRILQNLLSNSCKFTESHETVSLLVRRSDDMLLLEITDTGIGIPEEDQESIFDAFYRSRNVEGRRGLGLGLSIVREALLQMGGTIKVTSRIGKGTTMRVEIPLPDP